MTANDGSLGMMINIMNDVFKEPTRGCVLSPGVVDRNPCRSGLPCGSALRVDSLRRLAHVVVFLTFFRSFGRLPLLCVMRLEKPQRSRKSF